MFEVVREGGKGLLAFLRGRFMRIPVKHAGRSQLRKGSCRPLTYQCLKALLYSVDHSEFVQQYSCLLWFVDDELLYSIPQYEANGC
jgi:hypothetical protein